MTDAALLQAPLALLTQAFAQQVIALPSGEHIAVRRCGKSGALPPIVLLHGISSGAASWLHTAMNLAPHIEVIAWDAPGYGDSTPLPSPAPTDADYADRLHDLLSALGLRHCVLVGHSLGALMAGAYVRRYADQPQACQIDHLVLISPAGGYGSAAQADRRANVRADRQAALQQYGVEGLATRTAKRLLSPKASPDALDWVRWNAERLHPTGYLQAVELLCESDLGANAAAVLANQVPTSVFCGDADIVTPPAACKAWADVLGAPFELIAEAGHASPVEQASSIAECIKQACRGGKP